MEHSRHHPKKQQTARSLSAVEGQAGFSLIEILVVIAVMGAISAAIIVNWSSFMRHQELRQDAITLHKEILALKARAIEYGYDDVFACPSADDPCTITWYEPDETDETKSVARTKTITVNNGVTIDVSDATKRDGLPPIVAGIDNNKWKSTDGKVKIQVKADNFEAYTDNGWITLKSAKVPKESYRIQKDPSSIRPELYHQSTASSSWTRI
jgi:prepilin-type N-terminal cleavage/methylation domain-containing protein